MQLIPRVPVRRQLERCMMNERGCVGGRMHYVYEFNDMEHHSSSEQRYKLSVPV